MFWKEKGFILLKIIFMMFLIIPLFSIIFHDEIIPRITINDCINKQNKKLENIYELTCNPGNEFSLLSYDYNLLGKLVNLEKIKFIGIGSETDAQNFFSELTKLTKLKTVEIEDSRIGRIYKLGEIENLKDLSIDGRIYGGTSFQIKDLDLLGTDSRFNKLQSLTIKHLEMNEIPDLTRLSNLTKLTVAGYKLTSINPDSVNWGNLIYLEISDNSIHSLDNRIITNLVNLQSLNISYSDINDVKFVLDLPNLQNFEYRGYKHNNVNMECIKAHPNFKEDWLD